MPEWRYFLRSDEPDQAESGIGFHGLLRLRVGDPLLCAERTERDGRWHRTDLLYRFRMMGSTDVEITEIDSGRAERILAAWVKSGRIKRLPDPDQDDRPDGETMERFRALEAKVSAVWASVPIPPGVEQIGHPGPGRDE